jgi:hypothetical protein
MLYAGEVAHPAAHINTWSLYLLLALSLFSYAG